MMPLLVAAVAGVSMALQGTLNSVLGKKIGSFEASFIVHIIGAAILGVMLMVGLGQGDLKRFSQAPFWSYLGGPLSVLIIWGVLWSVGQAGVARANTAIVSSQIIFAIILDMSGITGHRTSLGWKKGVGALLLIVGVYLLLKEPR